MVDDTPKKTIEINGVKYQKKEQVSAEKHGRKSSVIAMMAAMGAMHSMHGGGNPKKRPVVDIIKEFKLIQAKKSNLSANDRQWVVRVFNEQYEKI